MVAVVVVVSIKSNTHPERVRILILLNIFFSFSPFWVPDKFTLQERKGKKPPSIQTTRLSTFGRGYRVLR